MLDKETDGTFCPYSLCILSVFLHIFQKLKGSSTKKKNHFAKMGKVVQIARIQNSLETQCYLTQAQRQTATAEQLGEVLRGETEGLLHGSKGEAEACTQEI